MNIDAVKFYAPILKAEHLKDGSLQCLARMTSESLDSQGEIVDYDGAKAAASEWKRNVREGHGGPPVGKAIEVIPNDNERAIDIRFLVSSGSKDTQAKILDGVLNGVSIGGQVNEAGRNAIVVDENARKQYPKIPEDRIGKQITILKNWKQEELAIVDVAANPESQGLTIVKNENGELILTEMEKEKAMEDKKGKEEISVMKADEQTTDDAGTSADNGVDNGDSKYGPFMEAMEELATQMMAAAQKMEAALASMNAGSEKEKDLGASKSASEIIGRLDEKIDRLHDDVRKIQGMPKPGGPVRMATAKRLGASNGGSPPGEDHVLELVQKTLSTLPSSATRNDVDKALALALMRQIQDDNKE